MVKSRQEKRFSEAEVRALRAELDALPRGSVTRKVPGRSVLYRGKPFHAEDGVCWRNVEEFLNG